MCVLALFSGDAVPGLIGRDGSAGDGSFGDGEEEEEPDRFLCGLCVFCCYLGALGSGLPPQVPLPHLTVPDVVKILYVALRLKPYAMSPPSLRSMCGQLEPRLQG